ADLRQQIERGNSQSTTLDDDRRKAVAKQEQLTAELARLRDAAEARERMLTDLRAELETERSSHSESRQSAERDKARVAGGDREKTKALQELTAALAKAREDAAESDRLRTAAEATLEAERTSSTQLRQDAEKAQAVAASLEREKAE